MTRKSEYIEYDNSMDAAPAGNQSFTLRANGSIFQHLYEYNAAYGKMPMHFSKLHLSRTIADKLHALFFSLVEAEFPESTLDIRYFHEIEYYNQPKCPADEVNRAELTLLSGTTMSLFSFRNGVGALSVDAYVGSDDEYNRIVAIQQKVAEAYTAVEEDFEDRFYMITQTSEGLDLLEYDINKDKMKDFDIDLLYNDDFKEVDATIREALTRKDGTGIVLLHGIYGSGKTTYLRHLISTVPKRIIYMPPDMASQLGSPAFFNFIRGYPNSILIIEDGENILKKRIEGGSAAISNILNLSDGIMGDALNIQVVCTFNAEMQEIDEALLRPGRLIASHYFNKLSKLKTKALVAHVHGEDEEPKSEEMTVAEIFMMKEKHHQTEKPSVTLKGFGFIPPAAPLPARDLESEMDTLVYRLSK